MSAEIDAVSDTTYLTYDEMDQEQRRAIVELAIDCARDGAEIRYVGDRALTRDGSYPLAAYGPIADVVRKPPARYVVVEVSSSYDESHAVGRRLTSDCGCTFEIVEALP